MSKLAILFERAIWLFKEMFAHLSFEFLFQLVQIVRAHLSFLLGLLKLFQNFMRRIVKVTRTSICEVTFSLIPILCRGMLTMKTVGRSYCLKWWVSVLFCEGTRGCCRLLSLLLRLLSFWRSIKGSLSRILTFYDINFIGFVLLMH